MLKNQVKFDRIICNEIKDNWQDFGFLENEIRGFIQLAKNKESPSVIKKLMIEKLFEKGTLGPQQKLYIMKVNQEYKLETLKKIQVHTLDNLFLNVETQDYHTQKHHYDWWMFPMHVPALWRWPSRNYDCSCNSDEVNLLLNDNEFFCNYVSGVALYLANLQNYSWNDYPVRFSRMLYSLSLFVECCLKQSPCASEKLENLATLSEHALVYAESNNFTHRYRANHLFMGAFELMQLRVAQINSKPFSLK